jgi:hypothetical protein
MKHLCTLLLLGLCATSSAQSIKTLGYNTTNGRIIAATNVVWTNAFTFSTNTVAAQVRTNLGLGQASFPTFGGAFFVGSQGAALEFVNDDIELFYINLRTGTNQSLVNSIELSASSVFFQSALSFGEPAATRTNLSLGLPALTNTSNVTMMRALAGSTNTNQPFSGVLTVLDLGAFDDTVQVTISNGIIISIVQ